MAKNNVFKKAKITNNVGDVVLVLVGYSDEGGKFNYAVYPVIGAKEIDVRMVVYKPVITRSLPAVSIEEASAMIDDRISRSSVEYNSELGMNNVIWNNKFAGFVSDIYDVSSKEYVGVDPTKTVAMSYDGTAVLLGLAHAYVHLRNYAFMAKHNISNVDSINAIIGASLSCVKENVPIEFIE